VSGILLSRLMTEKKSLGVGVNGYRHLAAVCRPVLLPAALLTTGPIGVVLRKRVIPDVAVEIQRLRIVQLCVRNGLGLRAPVRRHETAHAACVIPGAKVVIAGFGVAYFAGK
jgi:hypothetical protein